MTVLGNYRLLGPLEPGGTSSVFLAEHAVLGRPAAVKILRREQTTNPELVQRFLNEAKAATLIRHPGIVEVYDFGTAPDGTAYIVMELLQGTSLARRLAERGRLPELDAAFIARGIASALKAAHQQNIIHRDLSPANIFLVPDPDGPTGERIKVLDFGIAKLLDPKRAFQTQTGQMIGTPTYMAPEQARAASAVDHRADLYALGCILYEMLVGRPPFVSKNPGELIVMHLHTAPHPPSAYVPLSPQLDGIALRLLEKDPATRFQHAGEVLELLDALLSSLLGVAGRQGAGDRPSAPAFGSSMPLSIADERRPDEREPKSAMGIIAGVITVGIAAAFGLFIATRGGGDEASKPPATAGSVDGATATEIAPPPPSDTATPPAPAPAPAPTPTPAPPTEGSATPVPPPTPADQQTARPRDPRPARPQAPAGGSRKRPQDKPESGGGGPVTRPDGPITRPDSGGPVTSPSGSGKPAGETPSTPPPPPPPKPVEQPPPAAPPPDKLPDKPSAPHEGTP